MSYPDPIKTAYLTGQRDAELGIDVLVTSADYSDDPVLADAWQRGADDFNALRRIMGRAA